MEASECLSFLCIAGIQTMEFEYLQIARALSAISDQVAARVFQLFWTMLCSCCIEKDDSDGSQEVSVGMWWQKSIFQTLFVFTVDL